MPRISFVAPIQGFTDAAYRHFHAKVYGNVASAYFSPFLRIEHNEVRKRDINDITSPLGNNHRLIPQIIASGADEFNRLLSAIIKSGHTEIDFNLGCPFPPQMKLGRGTALLNNRDELLRIKQIMLDTPEISFSIKMRLGIHSPNEWQQCVDIINQMPLSHVTVHPRTASQQYKGELHINGFSALARSLNHPVIFNGELNSIIDIERIYQTHPEISGIMVGRGLLANPALLNELQEGSEWTNSKRLQHILQLHEGIYTHYQNTLCGEAQILSKIKPFWEYLVTSIEFTDNNIPGIINKKTLKLLKKATTISKYNLALQLLDY